MDHVAGLTEENRKVALDCFRMIQPHLDQDQSLQSVADAAGVPYRTAQRWVAQYRLFGLVALARKRRGDRGERRVVSAKLKEVIEGLALQSRPCRSRLYSGRCSGCPRTWASRLPAMAPSSASSDLGADLVTIAHEGTKAYSNTFELVHRREADGPNAIWQADHAPLDILSTRPDGQPAKPWLSIVIDDHSRAVLGIFSPSKTPPRCTHYWRCVRQFGAKKTPAGSCAESPMFSTRTMAATSHPIIWNKSGRT